MDPEVGIKYRKWAVTNEPYTVDFLLFLQDSLRREADCGHLAVLIPHGYEAFENISYNVIQLNLKRIGMSKCEWRNEYFRD